MNSYYMSMYTYYVKKGHNNYVLYWLLELRVQLLYVRIKFINI